MNTTISEEAGVSQDLALHRKATVSGIHYRISLQIPDSATQDIKAISTISFHLTDTNKAVQLDFKPDSSRIGIVKANGENVAIQWRKEHLFIDPQFLKKGINEVVVEYLAGNEALTRKADFLYTLFVPERARTFMPCFDQPDLKAVFEVDATLPISWQMVTNGKLKDSSVANGRKQLQFAVSDTIPTYLFSVAAGRFKADTRNIRNMPVTLYYRETDTAKINNSLDSIFAWHERSLQFLENYTGILFPYQKMDAVSIPDFQYGGMEHVGAIDYKEASLFLDHTATETQRMSRAKLIAHETAHMWFGNLVTMRWFNDVWMKEVFANFMADKITALYMPASDDGFQFFTQHFPAAYGVDRTEGANPIRQQLDNLNNAGSMYGAIIYDKAPIVMNMLESRMGKQAFQIGIQNYLKTYAHGNADWNQLIAILDKQSKEDLKSWNENWINKPGRPVLDYSLEKGDGRISKLILRQQGENGNYGLWPQQFEVALFYGDSIRRLPVNMHEATTAITAAEGLAVPDFILFNSSGNGYGLFPLDSAMLHQMDKVKTPMMRSSAYSNLYENMLAGRKISPPKLLALMDSLLAHEDEQLLVSMLSSQYQSCFWQYHTPKDREAAAPAAEATLWRLLHQDKPDGIRRSLYSLYVATASTPAAGDSLYKIWKTEKGPANIKLNEQDFMGLAATLALLKHPYEKDILQAQLKRIKNVDRKARFQYLLHPLSNDTAVRNSWFCSLAQKENRSNEEWISMGLSYLHHPLRRQESEQYLQKTLELLTEVRATGGVFFPTTWVNLPLSKYQSASAQKTVRDFLAARPDYNINLERKILQGADPIFRANKLLSK